MANESLWVRSNLRSYCAPGTHDFLIAEGPQGGVRWCARCMKEEPLDGSGCLICDLRGSIAVELVSIPGERVVGLLCETCHEGFAERSVIGGWAEELASKAGSQHQG